MFLSPNDVTNAIKDAEKTDQVVVIRCIRKGKSSVKHQQGELYDLHCGKKPIYKGAGTPKDRAKEDRKNGVLTVYATNRRNNVGNFGAWRRVNIVSVQKVILPNGKEYQVVES